MQVEWYGQSAFRLAGNGATVFIDPFGDLSPLAERGIQFDYPPIDDVEADLVLVTHEHSDHNGTEVIGGSPVVLRSTPGRHESPIGEVVAISSEHDEVAGTEDRRVPGLDGLRAPARFERIPHRSARRRRPAAGSGARRPLAVGQLWRFRSTPANRNAKGRAQGTITWLGSGCSSGGAWL
jgi:Beta-lactamase superfamily domain